jgi:hypothetical protein
MPRPSVIIAGHTNSGKTSRLLGNAIAAMRKGQKIILISDEDRPESLMRRLVSRGVQLQELISMGGGIGNPKEAYALRCLVEDERKPFSLFLDLALPAESDVKINRPAREPVTSTNEDMRWLINNAQEVHATHRNEVGPRGLSHSLRGELILITCDGENAPVIDTERGTDDHGVMIVSLGVEVPADESAS